ncbi:MAG: 2-oxoacid:ferredoxin oxidoreductase subunit beta [Tetrasphaera sp.]|jgi:2-oxoglutarate ferredoxin oxidoreductase subunit beta|nr:2-oxoacid:ferredoxin oxidoreductase subunit beta [Tetrasphaera sp.]
MSLTTQPRSRRETGVDPSPLGMPLPHGLASVPRLDPDGPAPTRKDYASDQEVRWCPGCGDYIILNTVQAFLPALGLRKENIVFVSGIGCSSRFPYYLDTFGMHSIHGRAPAIATGLATARPDLSVWVVTGDGDALSIGGNHLIHALRRNVNLTILLFNNRIYGLTKGQYSPTSEQGKITKSSPVGSVDTPFNPVSLALGAEATFVARSLDNDRAHLGEILKAAAAHRGTALVEIYQNCPIFNDGAFDAIKDRDQQAARLVHLVHGEPVRIGAEPSRQVLVRVADGALRFVAEAEAAGAGEVVVHDAHADDPSQQFALSRLDGAGMTQVPMGIFRQVERPTYDDGVRAQIDAAVTTAGGPADDADLHALLAGKDTWTVE